MDKKGKIALLLSFVLVIAVFAVFAVAKPGGRGVQKQCRDNIDNDGDGYTDWPSDTGCRSKNDISELGTTACDDGIDNDGDGDIDMSDQGCSGAGDNSEYGTNECDDGSDNDGDNAVDLNDVGCASTSDTDETNCGDGICEGGETSGSCVADCGMPDSCVDSDGGVEQYINGSVSGYLNNEFYLNSDFCADAINLVEYSCTGGINKVNTTISCAINATSCSIGVCI